MFFDGIVNVSPDSIDWQDYRSSNQGMVVTYTTDPVSEMAIREVPEEIPSTVSPDPHYESGTYGFFGCTKSRIRTAFVKAKVGYLIFAAKYVGASEEYRDRFFITGFFHIHKTADVERLHLRYLSGSECMDNDRCLALAADEIHFTSLEESLEVTDDLLREWGYRSRLTKQTRIILGEKETALCIDHVRSKPNARQAYIDETLRLQPHQDDEEDGEDDTSADDGVAKE